MLFAAVITLTFASCTFDTIKVRSWKCVEGGEFPEYQYPRMCSGRNTYVPSIFTVNNESIGASWSYALHPERSFKVNHNHKTPQYTFHLEAFQCDSNGPAATIRVQPVTELTSAQVMFQVLFILLLLPLLVVCCIADSSGGNSFTPFFLFMHDDDRLHFE